MHSVTAKHDEIWTEDIDTYRCTFAEVIRQDYTNCTFSAGVVEGHPIDTLYLKWERGGEYNFLILRPDEMAAIAWCATGALWSDAVAKVPVEQGQEVEEAANAG
jgi:hypothetical protein